LQAGGRRFDPVQLHHVYRLHETALSSALWKMQSAVLRAAAFFNNQEGKGSRKLDESFCEQRVELYLSRPPETKGWWTGGANTS
jgi:hypothetical protein